MSLAHRIFMSLVLFHFSTLFSLGQIQTPEARIGPTQTNYGTNLLVKLNSKFKFPMHSSDKVYLWLLSRQQSPLTQSSPAPLVIFDAAVPKRNESIMAAFPCFPSDETCSELTIANFTLEHLGIYSFTSRSTDYLRVENILYNISAYAMPLDLTCMSTFAPQAAASTCSFNTSTNQLITLPDHSIDVTCSIVVAQNDAYPIAAHLLFFYNEQEQCTEELTTYTPLTEDSLFQIPPIFANLTKKSDYKVNLIRLAKTCRQTFTKNEINRSFSCHLSPVELDVATPISLQQTQPFEKQSVTLDLHYGPVYTPSLSSPNKTLISGTSTAFTCPYGGNPQPKFYWRVVRVEIDNRTSTGTLIEGSNNLKRRLLTPSHDYSLSSKEFPIPNNLQIGTYVFECKALVEGLVKQQSKPIKFHLNIIAPPVVAKKGIVSNLESQFMQRGSPNIGAIIGGSIGGIALLIVIVVFIMFFLRARRKSPKKEIEKAKELDIDIHDGPNNPHINPHHHHHAPTIHQTINSANSSLSNQASGGKPNNKNNQQMTSSSNQNGIGQKIIAGLMVPSQTAQSYAAIAHAAAAAAQSNSFNQKISSTNANANVSTNPNSNENGMNSNSNGAFNTGSVNNIFGSNNEQNIINTNRSQSYNNPGFFDSTSYTIPNNLELPPPYDTALNEPAQKPQHQQQQQIDYMGSTSKLISDPETPTQVSKNANQTSLSYTPAADNTKNLSMLNSTPSNSSTTNNHNLSLQHLQQYQQQQQLQYTNIHNIEQNRARSRNPLNCNDQQQSQYTTITTAMGQLSTTPIDV